MSMSCALISSTLVLIFCTCMMLYMHSISELLHCTAISFAVQVDQAATEDCTCLLLLSPLAVDLQCSWQHACACVRAFALQLCCGLLHAYGSAL